MSGKPGVSTKCAKKAARFKQVAECKLIPPELAKGFGFLQSKPACHFAPVAITPDELGDCWAGIKAICRVRNEVNGKLIGEPWSGVDQQFSFAGIIEYATRTRSLAAGTMVARERSPIMTRPSE